MGRYELSRAFKATTGHAPWQYFTIMRAEVAADLIARHGKRASLAYVALESGFHDQGHLTRHFKRVIGCTPGQYRKILSASRCAIAPRVESMP